MQVSLNPFEIAYAFRSPVVGQASTAVTDDLLKEIGGHRIKYGPIVSFLSTNPTATATVVSRENVTED